MHQGPPERDDAGHGVPSPPVHLRMEGTTACVHLDDPGTRNALSRRLNVELEAAVEAGAAAGATAVVLTAAPPVFSSGGSIDELLDPKYPLEELYRGVTALAECPVPTIAAVAGPAIGAGTNLPLACDVILVSPGARFDPRFLDVGIHPGGGHLFRLRERLGYQGAAALALCGDVVTGEEAAAIGLAWRCVPEDELVGTARRFAERVASRPAELVRRTKQSLRAATSLEQAQAVEETAQRWSMQQSFFRERVTAIRDRLAKR